MPYSRAVVAHAAASQSSVTAGAVAFTHVTVVVDKSRRVEHAPALRAFEAQLVVDLRHAVSLAHEGLCGGVQLSTYTSSWADGLLGKVDGLRAHAASANTKCQSELSQAAVMRAHLAAPPQRGGIPSLPSTLTMSGECANAARARGLRRVRRASAGRRTLADAGSLCLALPQGELQAQLSSRRRS